MSLATVICECSLVQFSTLLFVSLFVHREPQQIFAAGHQPAADHILERFEIFRSVVQWFDGSMVRWSPVTAALCSQRFA